MMQFAFNLREGARLVIVKDQCPHLVYPIISIK